MKIIEYKDWSIKSYDESTMKLHIPRQLIYHHTWLPRASNIGIETVRAIQKYHINANGWDDIAYHFIIDSLGSIFEGREIIHIGSHCIPNTGKLGICMIGDYDPGQDIVTQEMLNSLYELTKYLCNKFKINYNEIYGHRDFYANKTCPGESIYQLIPMIKQNLMNGV